jgi:hypothetical protein
MDTMRVSDVDRERTAELLRNAVGDGRLDLTEFDERLRSAYAAVTSADLARVTVDLPAAPAAVVPAPTATPEADETADAWRKWLGGSILMIAIWGGISLATGELASFWPAIPITIWAAVLLVPLITGRRINTGCGIGR